MFKTESARILGIRWTVEGSFGLKWALMLTLASILFHFVIGAVVAWPVMLILGVSGVQVPFGVYLLGGTALSIAALLSNNR